MSDKIFTLNLIYFLADFILAIHIIPYVAAVAIAAPIGPIKGIMTAFITTLHRAPRIVVIAMVVVLLTALNIPPRNIVSELNITEMSNTDEHFQAEKNSFSYRNPARGMFNRISIEHAMVINALNNLYILPKKSSLS